MFCPKCGKQINDNAKFCGYCGNILQSCSDENTKENAKKVFVDQISVERVSAKIKNFAEWYLQCWSNWRLVDWREPTKLIWAGGHIIVMMIIVSIVAFGHKNVDSSSEETVYVDKIDMQTDKENETVGETLYDEEENLAVENYSMDDDDPHKDLYGQWVNPSGIRLNIRKGGGISDGTIAIYDSNQFMFDFVSANELSFSFSDDNVIVIHAINRQGSFEYVNMSYTLEGDKLTVLVDHKGAVLTRQ